MIIAEANPAKVVGIDPSESQVSYAAAHASDERAIFQVGNAMSLDFNDGDFDVVVSALVLNLVPDALNAIEEMKRKAPESGSLVYSPIPAGRYAVGVQGMGIMRTVDVVEGGTGITLP